MHLLGPNLIALCGFVNGFVTGQPTNSNCPSCLSIHEECRGTAPGVPVLGN